MRTLLILAFLVALVFPVHADVLRDVWDHYAPDTQNASVTQNKTLTQETGWPGKLKGPDAAIHQADFHTSWKYRASTYELYYGDQRELAASIYGLALHTKDVDKTLDRNVFLNNVLGFHYRISQICDWLNAAYTEKLSRSLEESRFMGGLLQDGVIQLTAGKYISAGTIHHVLAAAGGKKRSFETNLLHERLHVFWDEDEPFKKESYERWNTLTEEQRAEAVKNLHRYAQENTDQLIEEWAIKQAEAHKNSIQ